MAKKTEKKSLTKFNEQPVSPVDALVRKLDMVAHDMETRWGSGVLHNLCASETSAKFMRVKLALDDAIQGGDYDTVKAKSESLIRGWLKMEQEAKDGGYLKTVEAWYVCDKSGIEYIVCKHEGDTARMAALYPSRASAIYSLADIARMIENGSVVNCVKPEIKLYEAEIKQAQNAKGWASEMLQDVVPF